MTEINNLIKNHTLLVDEPEKGEPLTPCIGVNNTNIHSGGSIETLMLRIMVRGDLPNKDLIIYTWLPTASMRTLKYLFKCATKHKARMHQLDFIGEFL